MVTDLTIFTVIMSESLYTRLIFYNTCSSGKQNFIAFVHTAVHNAAGITHECETGGRNPDMTL